MWFRPLFLCISAVQALDLVNYGAFTVTATYSIANQLGFFTAYDLDVVFNQVPNSTFAYAQILNGDYDVLTGTIDNSVNLRLNSNESITVVGQLDQGPDLVLASVPNVTSVEQLKGKSLIVDSPTSGYAFLLRKVLSENGLSEGTDYIFQVEPPMALDNIV
jgi:ABC-type nitrate/sulfonate/bicarbonate transport system substrate-binding protein